MNPLKLEYVIIIFLLIIAIIVLFYKSIEPSSQPNMVVQPVKSILKKQQANNVTEETTKNNVKFYDVRMSQLSNDVDIVKNQQPTYELLSQYQPARDIVPTDNIYDNEQTGRIQNKPLRFNI
jgi:hypothetical protein